MPSVAVVPAAGKGERFGGAKLLARIDDDVLLDRTLRSLLDAGIDRIVVVIAPGADFRAASGMTDPRVHTVVNPDPSRGMFSSIRAGLAVADGDPILVLPADMPFVQTATVAAVAGACVREPGIVVPVHAGRRGHPVVFSATVRHAVLESPAHGTLKSALASTGLAIAELAVNDPGILRDVDRREDVEKINEP